VSDSWTLTDPDGSPYQSDCPGVLGGHRRSKIYGRLECRSALQALARGGYARNRVFFLDEHAAQAAGYAPSPALRVSRHRRRTRICGNRARRRPDHRRPIAPT
jgi:hypothetical protein